jgi:hypothetical protein
MKLRGGLKAVSTGKKHKTLPRKHAAGAFTLTVAPRYTAETVTLQPVDAEVAMEAKFNALDKTLGA